MKSLINKIKVPWCKRIGLSIVVALTMALLSGDGAFAATKTWTGAAKDKNFNTAANWSDNAVPASGDDIVLDRNSLATDADDKVYIVTQNVTLGKITFKCKVETTQNVITRFDIDLVAQEIVTLSGDVAVDENCDSSSSNVQGKFKLGSDITVSDVYFSPINRNFDNTSELIAGELDLNNHKLVMASSNGSVIGFQVIALGSSPEDNFDIKGQGILEYNIADDVSSEAFSILQEGKSTYSGITNLINTTQEGKNVLGVRGNYISMFGTSVVNVGKNGAVSYNFQEATSGQTIPNTFNIKGQVDNLWGVLVFQCYSDECNGGTLKVPGIVLQGNSALDLMRAEGKDLKIDLSGIQASQFCLEYWQDDHQYKEQVPDGFLNAPPACEIIQVDSGGANVSASADSVPGDPGTGVSLLTNPLLVVALGVITAGSLLIIKKKKSKVKA